jgi:site-specific DNA-methyltransferase (adenine-specific)
MIHLGDCIEGMKSIPSGKINMIFADPPYFLSNGGLSIHNGRVVSVNKGEWDKRSNCPNIRSFTKAWLSECYRLLSPEGTIWVSGTEHNIFDVHSVMGELGFRTINIVIWHKVDPPPLLYKNKFRFSYEYLIWAGRGKSHYFNYQEMYETGHQEMDDVWNLPAVQMSEKNFGYHPTQKPECLLERIILCSSKSGDVILDPFMGSGTTGAVGVRLGRKFVGFEKDPDYFEICKKRIAFEKKQIIEIP